MHSPSRILIVGVATAVSLLPLTTAAGATTGVQPKARAQLDILGMRLESALLVRAIAAGQEPLVKLALAAGADVNIGDENGRTPLLAAAAAQDWPLVATLLEMGAEPQRADAEGITPLMAAAAHGNLPTVNALLERGATIGAADSEARTALHYAAAAKRADVLEVLLEQTDESSRAPEDHSLAQLAFLTRDWKIIEPVLQREAPIPQWNSESRALLTQALRAKDAAKVRLLLSRHSKAPTPEGNPQPLLAHALMHGDMQTFRLLLEAGADPDTPLNSPVAKEFCEFAPNKVLRHYLATEPGMTTLMLAAGLGRAEAVRLLLEKGASRGTPTGSKHRLVALYFAAWANSTESLQALLGNSPKPEELRIEISLGEQRARLIRSGVPVFTTSISSGRAGFDTPAGEFVVTDKKSSHVSSIYRVKMPFFMRLSCKDFGLHQGHVPNYPASHGCIRLPTEAARKLFQDVPIGTLVTIR